MKLKVGMRVEITTEIDYHPHAMILPGTGTVVQTLPELAGIIVSLDDEYPSLWRWGNTILLVSPELDAVVPLLRHEPPVEAIDLNYKGNPKNFSSPDL